MLLPQSLLNTEIGRQLSQDVNAATAKTFAWITVQMLFQGLLPALLGCYLMQSNNLFVRFNYPTSTAIDKEPDSHDIQMPVKKSPFQSDRRPKGDERFAPPGYHQ